MGRWGSQSPTRARSRSPRDKKGNDRVDRDRGGDRTHRKRSRWEDGEDDGGKEVVRSRDGKEKERERERDEKGRRHDDRDRDRDRDRERRRRDDGGSSRRDRDRGGKERERDRSRSKDRNRDDRRPAKPRAQGSQEPREVEGGGEEAPPPPPKEAPNFSRTAHLITETNSFNGVVLKYVEPAEARLPPASTQYRLFIFKSSDLIETITLSTRTAWLFGRDRLVADVPIDHPSASKQHAVIQFRFVVKVNDWGEKEGKVKPYIIDLGSANGTTVNGAEIPKERYYELREKDVIGFGHSTREYVLMLEK